MSRRSPRPRPRRSTPRPCPSIRRSRFRSSPRSLVYACRKWSWPVSVLILGGSMPLRGSRYDASIEMPDLEREELITPLDRALVIFSHPDDAEFGAAATIAHLTAAGARVDYGVTTEGGKGTDDPAVTPAQLTATRQAEQRTAADLLGVSEIVHLGYPDGYLTPSLDLRRDIVRQIR